MEQHDFTMIKLITGLFYDVTMIIEQTYFSSYLKNFIIISFLYYQKVITLLQLINLREKLNLFSHI